MLEILFAVAIAGAAFSCPAMMWWNSRKGDGAACCGPKRAASAQDLQQLRAERAELDAALGVDAAPRV